MPIIGNVLGQIERDNQLRSRYLTPFLFSNDGNSVIDCPPYKENGISGFFNRLFNITPKDENVPKGSDKKQNSKSFFDRLFNRKK
jgi:penicillin-binding protein 1A